MAKSFDPRDSGYVDVAERIQEFYKAYPDGALCTSGYQVVDAGDQTFVVVTALAYRNDEDDKPGVGMAWEPVPGRTSFTKDSELMNAETSAWGRAIAALGFATKHIASANEVANWQSNGNGSIDMLALSKAIKAEGIESPKGLIANVTNSDADELEDFGRARKAVMAWAKDNSIDDPYEEILQRAREYVAYHAEKENA